MDFVATGQRQPDVEQHKMWPGPLDRLERPVSVSGFGYGEAGPLEHFPHPGPEQVVVVDDEECRPQSPRHSYYVF